MRILLTSHTYTAIGNHAKLVALAGMPSVELHVVIPQHWNDALFSLMGAVARGNYVLRALPVIGSGRIHAFVYRANLCALIHEIAPDILHIEQEPRSAVTAQWLWANAGQARVVIFTWENITQPARFPQSVFERYAFARAAAFIGGNCEAVELLRRHGWQGKTTVLPQLGVNIRDACTRNDKIRQRLGESFIIGYAGRLVEEKGIRDLVQATSVLPNTRLTFLGSGALKDWLCSLPNTAVFPAVPHGAVSEYIASMDVLVLPSHTMRRWKEQFGHVLIEAMSCGVPVVGSNSGAIPEVIGDAGLIFPEGDVNALRECLIRLQNDAALRADLAAKGRARVLAHYTHERIAEQTYAIYQELLSTR